MKHRPGAIERAALAWLSRPRTSVQIAALVGTTPNAASVTLRRLWRAGRLARWGGSRGHCYTYAVAAQDGRGDSERGGVVSHYPPARRMAPVESGGVR